VISFPVLTEKAYLVQRGAQRGSVEGRPVSARIEKTSEGIRLFNADAMKLQEYIEKRV
jgi:hypothetical protein